MSRSDETATRIVDAAKRSLQEVGYAALSTRSIAQEAGVPLSQIHYHYGSKRQVVLALLAMENEQLLRRQSTMYDADLPLWKQWEQACDFLEDDLASGYVRVLHEMTSAGWSDEVVAAAVRTDLQGWFRLLTAVAERFVVMAGRTAGGDGSLEARELATLAAAAFLGAEAMILLGFGEDEIPARAALRKIGAVVRAAEERAQQPPRDRTGANRVEPADHFAELI